MNTLTKLALGAMGRLRPMPAKGTATPTIALPAPETVGGMPLIEALSRRHSAREFAPTELPPALLANLLWAANGINRADGHHTAPSAMNAQEIDIYVALPSGGAYLYDAGANTLQLVAGSDVRRVSLTWATCRPQLFLGTRQEANISHEIGAWYRRNEAEFHGIAPDDDFRTDRFR
jgi:hypothetical protein